MTTGHSSTTQDFNISASHIGNPADYLVQAMTKNGDIAGLKEKGFQPAADLTGQQAMPSQKTGPSPDMKAPLR